MGIGFVLGALVGVFFGVILTAFIIMTIIRKSNEWGDLNGTEPSMTSFNVLRSSDNVKKSKSLRDLI